MNSRFEIVAFVPTNPFYVDTIRMIALKLHQVPRGTFDAEGGIVLQSTNVLVKSKGTTKPNNTNRSKQSAHVWFQRLGLAGPSINLKAAN